MSDGSSLDGHGTSMSQTAKPGVRVVLGTDGRACTPDLSILAEMRTVAQTHPSLPRETIVRMGTVDAADALGLASTCGAIAPAQAADLVAIELPSGEPARTSPDTETLSRLVLETELPVQGVWLGGQRIN